MAEKATTPLPLIQRAGARAQVKVGVDGLTRGAEISQFDHGALPQWFSALYLGNPSLEFDDERDLLRRLLAALQDAGFADEGIALATRHELIAIGSV